VGGWIASIASMPPVGWWFAFILLFVTLIGWSPVAKILAQNL
jgi:hypothetical protein